ncbi:MAG TPA: alkene reductase, partial [Candidatus Synoicihabitans sp.]|nr:alkene reductase [Candidatus Synoicihabitans sp.]
ISVWGAGRVGMHLSTRGDSYGIDDSNPAATFTYLARELGRRRLAFLFVRESLAAPRLGPDLKRAFGGPYIANERLTTADAVDLIVRGEADAAAWGQLFIANPDLPRRLIEQLPLNTPDQTTFYQGGERGYLDYPNLAAA